MAIIYHFFKNEFATWLTAQNEIGIFGEFRFWAVMEVVLNRHFKPYLKIPFNFEIRNTYNSVTCSNTSNST